MEQREYNAGDVIEYHDQWEHRTVRRTLTDADTAVMVDPDTGAIDDIAHNYATAESMVRNNGYIAVPVGEANRDRYGERLAWWREAYVDCWGG